MEEEIVFTEEDIAKMEKESTRLLGWTLMSKTGMTIKGMLENPELARERIIAAKDRAGFVDRIKLNKLLEALDNPNWKAVLKEKLGA